MATMAENCTASVTTTTNSSSHGSYAPPSGGATLSTADEVQRIPSFAPNVLLHLKRIYESFSTASSRPEFLATIQHEVPIGSSNGGGIQDPLSCLSAFLAYMAGASADAMHPGKDLDLSAPISNYFISSSHNTYLTGNQLYSDADTRSYTDVLLRGCRCLEIDVWDGELDSPSSTEDDSSSSDEDKAVKKKEQKKKNQAKEGKKVQDTLQHNSLSNKLARLMKRRSSSQTPHVMAGGVNVKIAPMHPEPRVLHGYTLTKEITFRDVCYAIRDSAFVTSDLPVIVSLEVHAGLEQQETMVEIMREAWKGLLVDVTPEFVAREDSGTLPSLGDLKRKILIKVKWVAPTNGGGDALEDAVTNNPLEATRLAERKERESDARSLTTTASAPSPEKTAKVLLALSGLAVYTRAYHFDHFAQPEAALPNHVFSLSEAAAREAHESQRHALFDHNRKFMMRVYPSGMRVNSSNLDPSFFWRRGVQMVALNWQNRDKGMMLNEGMFSGMQGWVLKPAGYREEFDHRHLSSIVRRTVDLSIEVFAAQGLPLPPGDSSEQSFRPYVSCQLHVEQLEDNADIEHPGANSKNTRFKRRTKTCTGIDPDFGGETLAFPTAKGIIEELSFLRFKVKDDKFGRDDLAAWACTRIDRLQEGYRFVHLFDASGVKSKGLLLTKITKILS